MSRWQTSLGTTEGELDLESVTGTTSDLVSRCISALRHAGALALIGILLSLVSTRVVADTTITSWRGGPAPPLSLRNLSGKEVTLEQYRGRVVVVNFWATWCAPCVEELPSLELLRDRFRTQGLDVLTVNYQENAGRIAPFLERFGIELPVVRDHDGSAREAWGVTVFPTTFVVGPDQNIAFVVTGAADWTSPAHVARIRDLVSRSSKSTTH